MKSFNGWLLSKINLYLTAKEGCQVETSAYTPDGIKSVILDSFGFRYEITIKTLGRTQAFDGGNDLFKYAKELEQKTRGVV